MLAGAAKPARAPEILRTCRKPRRGFPRGHFRRAILRRDKRVLIAGALAWRPSKPFSPSTSPGATSPVDIIAPTQALEHRPTSVRALRSRQFLWVGLPRASHTGERRARVSQTVGARTSWAALEPASRRAHAPILQCPAGREGRRLRLAPVHTPAVGKPVENDLDGRAPVEPFELLAQLREVVGRPRRLARRHPDLPRPLPERHGRGGEVRLGAHRNAEDFSAPQHQCRKRPTGANPRAQREAAGQARRCRSRGERGTARVTRRRDDGVLCLLADPGARVAVRRLRRPGPSPWPSA